MRAATSTLTARLIAEWMSFVGWLHTAVRKDSRALALFADTEDPADEAGGGTTPKPGRPKPATAPRSADLKLDGHQPGSVLLDAACASL